MVRSFGKEMPHTPASRHGGASTVGVPQMTGHASNTAGVYGALGSLYELIPHIVRPPGALYYYDPCFMKKAEKTEVRKIKEFRGLYS